MIVKKGCCIQYEYGLYKYNLDVHHVVTVRSPTSPSCVTSLPLINLHPWPHGIVKWPLNVHFRTTADIAGDPDILSYSFQILWKNNFIQQFFSSVSVFIFSYSHEHASMSDTKAKKLLKKVFIFVFFVHKKYSCSFRKLGLNHWHGIF